MEQLLSVQITPLAQIHPSTPLLSFSILYPPPSLFLSEPAHSPEPPPLPSHSELPPSEAVKREYDALLAAHEKLQQIYAELAQMREETKQQFEDLKQEYEGMRAEQGKTIRELLDANETLKREIEGIEADLTAREEHIKRLSGLLKERDSRKKNSEKLLDQLEKRNKELISEHIKRSLESEDLRKRTSEHISALQKAKEDLLKQDENRRKREEQIQGLLGQIKRREVENTKLAKEMRRKDEENRDLVGKVQAISGKNEQETKLKAQKELDQMRSLAAAKEGEMRVVKEMIRSYHHQLKQKEVEVVRFKRKAEVKRVRLPPLEEQKASKSHLSSIKDLSRRPDTEEDRTLEDLIARSQQAFQPPKLDRSVHSSQADLKEEKARNDAEMAEMAENQGLEPREDAVLQPEETDTEAMQEFGEVSGIQRPDVREIPQRERSTELSARRDGEEDPEGRELDQPSELISAPFEENADKSLDFEQENEEKSEENQEKAEISEEKSGETPAKAAISGEEEYKEDWTDEQSVPKAVTSSQYNPEGHFELIQDSPSKPTPPASP